MVLKHILAYVVDLYVIVAYIASGVEITMSEVISVIWNINIGFTSFDDKIVY